MDTARRTGQSLMGLRRVSVVSNPDLQARPSAAANHTSRLNRRRDQTMGRRCWVERLSDLSHILQAAIRRQGCDLA